MAWHHTKIIVDTEPIEFGAAEEEMHLPQMAGEGNEETKVISTHDSVICEPWHRWEDSLRTARRVQQVMVATLQDWSRGEPLVHVTRLTKKEEENLGKWRE